MTDYNIDNTGSIQECNRCGKCCLAGGPALHLEDRKLVVNGTFLPSDLILFRRGEPAFHPVERQLITLEHEMIKLRGKNDIGQCKFLLNSASSSSCAIYHNRPLECRVLKCWDTSDIEEIMMKDLLTRSHLIPPNSFLNKLISYYELMFPLTDIIRQFKAMNSSDQRKYLENLIRGDCEIRAYINKQYDISFDDLKFYIGRTLKDILMPLLK